MSQERDQKVSIGAQLLLAPDTAVTCPKCDHEFSLEQGFARKALEQIEGSSQGALRALEQTVRLAEQKRAARDASEREQQALEQVRGLRKLLDEQSEANRAALAQMREIERRGFADQMAVLNTLLAERDAQLRVSAERELGLLAAQQRLADEKAALELEIARRMQVARAEIETQVRAFEKERADFDKAELQKKLDDVSAKLAEAQRKAEQGSQQLQGEVLELALEEQMRRAFPVDVFEEVRKGVRGADLLQRVTTRSLQTAGTLLWEAKRAKEWGRDWPAKLKEDMRASGAEVGILVTTTLPREIPPGHVFGVYEDIWVTTWAAAVPLAAALRERVLEVHKQRLVSSGKGEKMEALYDYLTSPQFAQKLKAVYAAFRTMQDDLARERSQAEQRWARREKQIATGLRELLGFAGDVQGLSVQTLQQLELEPEQGQAAGETAASSAAADAGSAAPGGTSSSD